MTQNNTSTSSASADTTKHKIRARDHPAREAVVYSDRAEICRPIRGLSLKAGRNEIEVVGLSSQLSGETIRVETTSRIVILDVSHHRSKVEPDKDDDDDEQTADEEAIDLMEDVHAVEGNPPGRAHSRATRKHKRAKLWALERQKEDLNNELERLNMDYKLLDSYAFMFAGKGQEDSKSPTPTKDVKSFQELMEVYGSRSRMLATKTLKCKREIRDIERRITRERNRLNAVNENKNVQEWITAKVVLEAEEALDDAEFRLSYVVHGARWTPRYDIRVSSDSQQLTLHYMAEVVQSTSESWNGVRMKLSTAMPSLQTTIPDKINPWRVTLRTNQATFAMNKMNNNIPPPPPPPQAAITSQTQLVMATQFVQQQQQMQAQQAQHQPATRSAALFGSAAPAGSSGGFGSAAPASTGGFGSAASADSSGFGASLFGAPPAASGLQPAIEVPMTEISEFEIEEDEDDDTESTTGPAHAAALLNGMMSVFEVNADATVPSDNAPHRVTIAVLDIKATFIHVAFPKITGCYVYLRAFAKNDTDLPLFPGPCNVYVDGSYVTKSHIPRVAVGERFTCPLGADSSVSIAYPRRKKKMLTGGFLNRVRMQSIEQSIHLRNGRSKPIFVQIFDQLPVSEEERLRVELTEPAKAMVKWAANGSSSHIMSGGTDHHHDAMALPGLCSEEAATTNIEQSANTKNNTDGLPTISTGNKKVRRHPNGLLEWTLHIPATESKSVRFNYQVDCAIEDIVYNL
ncbi:hypothetical protein BDF22DRAFT_668908 [Syncephalis plumigaleata]|nr:hypothetical protein BDF22DRAFT_668908 [Syncephalis plumigaleata]